MAAPTGRKTNSSAKTPTASTAGELTSDQPVQTGVDLNRNYGYHFGRDPADADPCSETFRGPTPFSEPETQAIQDFTTHHKRLVAAMNFHSYGNLWIHPFNYLRTKNGYPTNLEPTIVNFYEEFKVAVGLVSEGESGNAFDTVSYATDGEGSDWMLGERKIIAFSPELGCKDAEAQDFWPAVRLIAPGLTENWQVITMFLDRNSFRAKDISYGFDQRGLFFFTFFQEQLASIYDSKLSIKDPSGKFVQELSEVTVEHRPGELVQAQLKKSARGTQVEVKIPEITRLQNLKLLFKFKTDDFKHPLDLELIFETADEHVFLTQRIAATHRLEII